MSVSAGWSRLRLRRNGSINQKTFAAYKDPDSPRDLKLLPGRTHFLCGQPGWEETAQIVHSWLGRW